MKARQVGQKISKKKKKNQRSRKRSRKTVEEVCLIAMLITKQRCAAMVCVCQNVLKKKAPAHMDTQVAGKTSVCHITLAQ